MFNLPIYDLEKSTKQFDPFKILNVDSKLSLMDENTLKDLRKTYKKLSLK